MRWFLERIDIQRRVVQIKYQSSESAQSIYIIGVVHIISIVGVCPVDIHRRFVHNIDYRSRSTIYIGGLSTVKNKYPCLEMVFIHGRMHV